MSLDLGQAALCSEGLAATASGRGKVEGQPKATKQKSAEVAWLKHKLWAGWHGDEGSSGEGAGLGVENGLGSWIQSWIHRGGRDALPAAANISVLWGVLGCLGTLGAR